MGLKEAIRNPTDLSLDKEFDSDKTSARTTYLRFFNPNHELAAQTYSHGEMEKHFNSAKWLLLKAGEDRIKLVGRFIYAVRESVENDNDEPLDELVDDIKK